MNVFMKPLFKAAFIAAPGLISVHVWAQEKNADTASQTTGMLKHFIDVHEFEPGKISDEQLAGAHAKDRFGRIDPLSVPVGSEGLC